MNKTIKRIIYGMAFLAVLAIIATGVYFFALKPGPSCFDNKQNGAEIGIDCGGTCVPCAEKSISPLQISWKRYFISKSMTAVAIEVKNPNQDYGADYFDYKISLFDGENKEITTMSGNSFIYSGEIKHIVEILPVFLEPGKTVEISAEFSNATWKSKEKFSKPEMEVRSLSGELRQSPPTIKGVATNKSAFPVSKTTVFGFIYNDFGLIGAASKTEIGAIPAFGEKPFIINFPRDLDIKTVNPDNFRVFIEASH